jgi:uncharacterized caspase-like protein
MLAAGTTSRAQRSSCVAAAETINWVREKLARQDIPPTDVARVLAHLELSTQNCATNGDLWYYRSVVERRLGEPAAKIAYSLRKAAEWRSDALARYGEAPAAPRTGAPVGGPVAQKWALVVGVNQFTDTRIKTLNYAAKDATDFHASLIDPTIGRFAAARVRVLVDAAATLSAVRSGIGWLRANVGPNDLVVVYMASHGSPREFDPNGVSYVMLHDTNATNAESMYASALQMIDLVDDLTRDLNAGRVVLVLDTCFSGDATRLRMTRSLSLSAPALNGFVGVGGRVVIAAASGDQPSFESAERKNGYFTYFLVDALRRSKGEWPLKALFEDVRENVSRVVQRELNATQTPMMSGSAEIETIRLGAAEGTPVASRRAPPASGFAAGSRLPSRPAGGRQRDG